MADSAAADELSRPPANPHIPLGRMIWASLRASKRKALTPDSITCLECGKQFKSLRRHIRTDHGLEPSEYREKWGLKADYPMVAPNYAEQRSALAKSLGLGRKKAETVPTKGRGKRAAKAEAPAG